MRPVDSALGAKKRSQKEVKKRSFLIIVIGEMVFNVSNLS
jgi:hypothetical protein